MNVEPVPAMRSTVTDTPEGLVIEMPARRVVLFLVFLPIWLVAWLLAESFVAGTFLKGPGGQGGATAFLAVWLTMWTLGGLFAAASWCWMVFGQERLVVGSGRFVHSYELFGLRLPREYDVQSIRNLRAAPNDFVRGRASFALPVVGANSGAIAFDYGSKTVFLGSGLDEAEGRMIVQHIRARAAIPDQGA
jgi:hypothetical protein